MAKYKIIFEGEEQDEVFNTYDDAEDYANNLVGDYHEGGEILEMSNPGDYPYAPDYEPEYIIVKLKNDALLGNRREKNCFMGS